MLKEADKAANIKLAICLMLSSDPEEGIAVQDGAQRCRLVVCQNGQAGMHIVMAARYATQHRGLTGDGNQ